MSVNRLLLFLAFASALLAATISRATAPVQMPISGEAIQLSQIVLELSSTIKTAIGSADIPAKAVLSEGTVTRGGMPGNYTDRYDFKLVYCGGSSTTPCKWVGCLVISRHHKNVGGQEKIQNTINANRECVSARDM